MQTAERVKQGKEMNEVAKHTPGPWTLLLPQPAEDEDGTSTGGFSYPGGIEGADGNPVCEFGTLAGSGTMFENEADHHLIAAAPDLLAACKAQHTAIDILMAMLIERDPDFRPTQSRVWPMLIQGNDAVARAESHAISSPHGTKP